MNPAVASRLVFSQQPTNTVSTQTIVRLCESPCRMLSATRSPAALPVSPSPSAPTGAGALQRYRKPSTRSAVWPPSAPSEFDRAGSGYTLTASATSLTGATSTAFDITVGPATRLVFTTKPSMPSLAPASATRPRCASDSAGRWRQHRDHQHSLDHRRPGSKPGSGTLSGTLTVDASLVWPRSAICPLTVWAPATRSLPPAPGLDGRDECCIQYFSRRGGGARLHDIAQ